MKTIKTYESQTDELKNWSSCMVTNKKWVEKSRKIVLNHKTRDSSGRGRNLRFKFFCLCHRARREVTENPIIDLEL